MDTVLRTDAEFLVLAPSSLSSLGFSRRGPGAAAPGGVSGVSPDLLSLTAPEGSARKKPTSERRVVRSDGEGCPGDSVRAFRNALLGMVGHIGEER
jgi:hypothetical protein